MMRLSRHATAVFSALMMGSLVASEASAQSRTVVRGPQLPEIRISQQSGVPACVTPDRLMRFLTDRNTTLEPRFRDIAALYKRHGEALAVRWDYAFFQMLLETNYLTFKRGNGDWGDVRPHQNNFAGIGATGGGVPGDRFPDVSTGVLAQMQHLVAYSGEAVQAPAAQRTRDKQSDIISASRALQRPVRFSDLTQRWAADRNYAKSIDFIASRFFEAHCAANAQQQEAWRSETKRMAAGAMPRPALRPATPACGVWAASFGGPSALLIRSQEGATVNYTVLEVESGREQPQADAYISAHARNGSTIGRFASRDQALARAFELCREPS